MAATLRLERAGPRQERVLKNLFQLYFHELSDFLAAEVDAQGLFDAWDDRTLTTPGHEAYLLKVGPHLAGFLVIEITATPRGAMREFADIFILRRYRRQGLGLEVVRRIMYSPTAGPQPWLVAIFRRDDKAQQFWRQAFSHLAFASVNKFDDPDRPEFLFFDVRA